jgi:putative NADH-flavin reductase
MRIAVFGANGPTGRLVTEQALAAGHVVTAITRHPEDFPIRDAHLTVLAGDVYDQASVDRAVDGQDAVLSSLGVPFGKEPITVYSQGMTNIIQAMDRGGVRRLICVTSSAVDPAAGPHGGFFFEKVLQPFVVGVLGKTLYADMTRMEAIVKDSDLDWIIVRPSGLFETPAVTDYHTAERYLKGKFTSRADLANSMLAQVDSTEYLRKVMAVATVSEQPSLLSFFMKEAVSKGDQQKVPAKA